MGKILITGGVSILSGAVLFLLSGIMLPFEVTRDGGCAFIVEPSLFGEDVQVECGTYDELEMGLSMSWEAYHSR